MGRQKEQHDEAMSRGFYFVNDKYICIDCLDDEDFLDIFNRNSENRRCSYCHEEIETVELGYIIDRILLAIRPYYYDFNDAGMSYDDAREYLNDPIYSFEEILQNIGFNLDQQIIDDMAEAVTIESFFDDSSLYESLSTTLSNSYRKFTFYTKHIHRYFFSDDMDDYDFTETKPIELMESICRKINEYKCYKKLESGTEIFRARVGKNRFSDFSDLSAPPKEKSIYSNRFSPAGIPMFYGSLNKITCMKELNLKKTNIRKISIGKFITKCDMKLIDLSRKIDLPGFFTENTTSREDIIFINKLIEEISKPVIKDGREHIEYVPTQIVNEYIKMIYKDSGENILGIIYNSSKDISQKNILLYDVDKIEEILDFDSVEHESIIYGFKIPI